MTILKEFEYEDHMSDIKIVGHGNTPKRAIEAVILGTANLIYDTEKVDKKETIEITFKTNDILEAIYNSVKEFLNLFYFQKFAIRDVRVKHLRKIKIRDKKIYFWETNITFFGEKYDINKHGYKKEIKSATYYDLSIKKITKSHWLVEVVVDV
ncbi:MAG: archease [Nanopusillaceae archaeon]